MTVNTRPRDAQPWNVNPGFVSARAKDLWRDLAYLVPAWDGGGPPWDYARNVPWFPFGGATKEWVQNARGAALAVTTLTTNSGWVASPSALGTTEVTVLILKKDRDGSHRTGGAFGIVSTSGAANFCGAHIPYTDGTVYWDYGGQTGGTSRISVAGLTFGDDIWVFTAGPRGMEIWQNGSRRASQAGHATRSTANIFDFQLGNGNHLSSQTENSDLAEYAMFAVWNRQLDQNDIEHLSSDPWELVRYEPRRLKAPPSSLNFSLVGTIDLELELEGSRVFSHEGTIDLELDVAESPAPPTLDFAFTGSIDLELELESDVAVFYPVSPGESYVEVYNPAGVLQGTLTPLHYKISRYENQVGNWSCALPLDEEITATVPLAADITYGWKISITQENFPPLNGIEDAPLMYQGIVEDRQYQIDQGGNAYVALQGSFRTYALVRQSVHRNLEFSGSLAALTTTVASTLLDPHGPIVPASASSATVAGNFSDISRFEAWAKGAKLGRHVIRETWDHDRPELVKYDGPPSSGLTFRLANDSEKGGSAAAVEARHAHDNGGTGVALIAGTPRIRYDGANLVNRIIAKGVDTIEDPEDPESTISSVLTLQHATFTSPYQVKAGANPDATLYYYIEDEDSIDAYGLTELVLTFSEVKNPNDDSVSRSKAANVLYMKAVNILINRRSEKVEVILNPIANGSRIWALPGDSAMVEYHGEVETESGASVWMEMDKKFLITERHDESHPSGIRRVGYKLAAPEMEFPVPGLPDEISLPPDDGPGPEDPSTPDGPSDEPCCEDPNTDENEGPEDDFEEDYPPPEPLSFQLGAYSIPAIALAFSALWDFEISDPNDYVTVPPTVSIVPLPSLGAGTFTVSARVSVRADPFGSGSCTYMVAIRGGGGSLGTVEYPGVAVTMMPGEINDADPSSVVQVPTVTAQFAAGEHTSVSVRIYRIAGTNLVHRYNPTEDSYIRVTFA